MQCFHCGECCRGSLLVTSQELTLIYERTKLTLPAKEIRPNRFQLLIGCPFRKDNRCSIYEIRPCQCRLYHCGRLKPTDRKLESLVDIRKLMLENPEYRAFKEKMDAEAIEWGNAHGWNWRKIAVGDHMVLPQH